MDNHSGFSDRLARAISQFGHLCAGIDPSKELLLSWGLPDSAEGLRAFSDRCLDAFSGTVGVVKPQVAFFERHGAAGLTALEALCREAHDRGFVVIGDAKRGDLDSTAAAYADAWLQSDSPFCVDAVTMHAYLGIDALEPCFLAAARSGRGIFVVVRSSNEQGRLLQCAHTDDGTSVEASLLSALGRRNVELVGDHGDLLGPFGAVIGPTHDAVPLDLEALRGPVLAPGLGAQGGTADGLAHALRGASHKVVTCNLSRAILSAGPDPDALRGAAIAWQDSLRRALS